MPGPRDYTVGTRSALFALAKGTCYFPDCGEPVVREVEGFQTTNVQITHIRGAYPGSARYDESMTDAERANFDNVMLMCKPHHDLIDRLDPSAWPYPVLEKMKAEREADTGADTGALRGITFRGDELEDVLRDVIRGATLREVTATVAFGLNTPAGWLHAPIEGFDMLREANPHLRNSEFALVINITNVGMLDTFVNEVAFYFRGDGLRGEVPAITHLGRNDYPLLNPQLPKRLRVGEATNWMTRVSTVHEIVAHASSLGVNLATAWAEVRLATGDSAETDDVALDSLPST